MRELGELPGWALLRQPYCCHGRVAGSKVRVLDWYFFVRVIPTSVHPRGPTISMPTKNLPLLLTNKEVARGKSRKMIFNTEVGGYAFNFFSIFLLEFEFSNMKMCPKRLSVFPLYKHNLPRLKLHGLNFPALIQHASLAGQTEIIFMELLTFCILTIF